MDAAIHDALDHSQTVDITTIGRRTGEPRRIEIALHNIRRPPGHQRRPSHADAGLDLQPRGRSAADRASQGAGAHADLEGTARVVTDPEERRALLVDVARAWNRTDVDLMVELSPLIEVDIPGYRVAVPS